MNSVRSSSLFVYGTLLPGARSWVVLEPFVDGLGVPDSVSGELFDTGLGYPTVIVDEQSANTVYGRTFELDTARSVQAMEVLDEFEDLSVGLFRRVIVTTELGRSAWVYVCGVGFTLTRIPSGNWMAYNPS